MNVFVAPTAPSTLSYRGNPGSFIMLCCTPFALLLLMPVPRGVLIYFKNLFSKSMGSGKMMVEFFSAEMVDKVCAKREKKVKRLYFAIRQTITREHSANFCYTRNKITGRNLNDVVRCITWRYRNCRAAGDWLMTIAASLRAVEALYSPSAAMTLARASRDASASAAMARCSCTGKRTSLL